MRQDVRNGSPQPSPLLYRWFLTALQCHHSIVLWQASFSRGRSLVCASPAIPDRFCHYYSLHYYASGSEMAIEPQGKTQSFLRQFVSSRHLRRTSTETVSPSCCLCPRSCSVVDAELVPTAVCQSALELQCHHLFGCCTHSPGKAPTKSKPPYPTEIPAQNAAENVNFLALFFDYLKHWCTNSPCCSKFKLLIYIFMAFQKTCSCLLPLCLTNPGFPSITPKSVSPSYFLPYFSWHLGRLQAAIRGISEGGLLERLAGKQQSSFSSLT